MEQQTDNVALPSENSGSMNELVQTVNARELYERLGLDKSHWSRWYKSSIVSNPFALENVDYVGFAIMANGNRMLIMGVRFYDER